MSRNRLAVHDGQRVQDYPDNGPDLIVAPTVGTDIEDGDPLVPIV